MKTKGFTLVELAGATVILATVAAAIAPAVVDTEEARRQTCMSNEQKIGDAMLQYVEDNDYRFPMHIYYQNDGGPYNWQTAIDPYFKGGILTMPNVWYCPSFPVREPAEYGVNLELSRDGAGTWTAQSTPGFKVTTINYSSISFPGEKAMVVEKGSVPDPYEQDFMDPSEYLYTNPLNIVNGVPTSPDTHNELQFDFDCLPTNTSCQSWGTTPSTMPRFRHKSKCNILMTDGHVKSTQRRTLDWYKNIYIAGAYESLEGQGPQ